MIVLVLVLATLTGFVEGRWINPSLWQAVLFGLVAVLLWRRTEFAALSQTRRKRSHEDSNRQHCRRHRLRHDFSPPHFPHPGFPITVFGLLLFTDSPAHRAALPDRPANRSRNTDRDSFPRPEDRSLLYPARATLAARLPRLRHCSGCKFQCCG